MKLPNIPSPPKVKSGKLSEFFKWRKDNLVSKEDLTEFGGYVESRAIEVVNGGLKVLDSKIDSLEQRQGEEQRRLSDYWEKRLGNLPSKQEYEFLSKKLETGLQLIKAQVIAAAENTLNSRLRKINENIQFLEQRGIREIPSGPPRKPGDMQGDLIDLKREMSGLRDMLVTEVRVIKEEEIPQMAKSIASGMSASLARMEEKGEFAEMRKAIAEVNKRLQHLERKASDEDASIRNWLKKLEQEFNEELIKIIEWINYFRSSNLEVNANPADSGGVGAAKNSS